MAIDETIGVSVYMDSDVPQEWIDQDGGGPILNLQNPFEKVIAEMVKLQRQKAKDYAADGDILATSRSVVSSLNIDGYDVKEDMNAMVLRKCGRITNLRGRSASNESVRDSYLDRAIYAVFALVALDDEHG
jgi:hypothetical protein